MSYWDIATMAGDSDLFVRCRACAAQEGIADPNGWTSDHMLHLAASPGWSEAWASAIASDNPQPGRDPAVISDPMILSAVQATNTG